MARDFFTSAQHTGVVDMIRGIKYLALAVMVVAGALAVAPQSHAAACANGMYRAGCVGPNGALMVRKPAPVHRARPPVTCANGVYRAGCVGPHGAAVVRKP
jgi:hypothetical protein